MTRRNLIKGVSGTAAGFMLSKYTLGEERGQKRPNVLLIVSDNQRPDTIAALGNKHIT